MYPYMKFISELSNLLGISTLVLVLVSVSAVLALASFVIYIIVGIVTGRGTKLSVGGVTLGLNLGKGASTEQQVTEKAEPPKEEPHKPPMHGETPFCAVVRKASINRTKEVILEHMGLERSLQTDILRQQMNFAEEKIAELKTLLCNGYADALSVSLNLGFSEAKNTPNYRTYRMMLSYILLEKIKDPIIKKAVVENHFLDLSNLEFEQYCHRKTGLVIDTMGDALDEMYVDISQILTRADVLYINDVVLFDSRVIIKSIFAHAREIAGVYGSKIDANREEMSERLEEISQKCS